MSRTVALLAPGGAVGSASLKYLLPLHTAGKIDLLLLVRPGTSSRDAGKVGTARIVEVDLDGEQEALEKAVAGVQILISGLSLQAASAEVRLVEIFSRSPDFITFIPAAYSLKMTPQDLAHPALAPLAGILGATFVKAAELGVSITHVYTGIFLHWFFQVGFVANFKGNALQANKGMLAHPVAITTMDHLGAALAHLTTLPAAELKNAEFSAVTYLPTGQDLVELFTALHGTAPTVTDYDQAAKDADYADAPFGPVVATYKHHWETGVWGYPQAVPVEDYEGKGTPLVEVARQFL